MFNLSHNKRNANWKLKGDAMFHLSDQPVLKSWIIPCVGKNVREQSISYATGRHINWYNLYGRQFDNIHQNLNST